MHRYSNIELSDIIFAYGNAYGNASLAATIYQERYPDRVCPYHSTFTSMFQRLRETGSVRAASGPPRVIDEDRRAAVLDHFDQNPTTSTRRAAAVLGYSRSTVWSDLNDEGLHPYHYQRTQFLRVQDEEPRQAFCNFYLQRIAEDEEFSKLILFSDEASFTRVGIFNQRNVHLWKPSNPRPNRVDG